MTEEKQKQTETNKKVSKQLVSRRTIPYTPEKVLEALRKTYPDDFPWNGSEALEKIGGGETITIELTRVMS